MSRGINLYRPPEGFPHGTRARYVGAKCRCDDCRRANREYHRQRAAAVRAGECNGLVDAAPVRAHLLALSARGVGFRAVAAACDVALSVVRQVRTGKKPRIRAKTARRILAVDAAAISDGGLVLAGPTRAAIREMLRAGLTKTEIAQRLGYATPALQLTRRRVTAANALRIQRLLREVRAEVAEAARIGTVCTDCGESHERARRVEWLRRHSDVDPIDAADAKPCWWGGESGRRALARDRNEARRAA